MPQAAVRSSHRIDRVFHALGDGTRRSIVETLRRRPHSVSHLADSLGISLTAVGQHLQILEESKLVLTRKTGRVRECQLNVAGLKTLEDWARELRTLWEKRFDRLGELLDEE